MIEQMNAGMLLCLCSKNNEKDVLDVFDQRRRHAAASASTSCRVAHQLEQQVGEPQVAGATSSTSGLDSFIFIDDNPVECADVRINCPGVLTLQLPRDAESFPSFLNHVWAFDRAAARPRRIAAARGCIRKTRSGSSSASNRSR